MKKELEEMMKKVYANEKALKYLHGFVKMMISRYGIQGGDAMDKKQEIIALLDSINDAKFLDFLCELIVSFKRKWGI